MRLKSVKKLRKISPRIGLNSRHMLFYRTIDCSSCHHLYQATVNPLPPFLTRFMRSSSAVLSHVLEGCATMGTGTSHASGPCCHCHDLVCNIAKLRNFTYSKWITFRFLFFLSLPILSVTWPHFHDIGARCGVWSGQGPGTTKWSQYKIRATSPGSRTVQYCPPQYRAVCMQTLLW